MINLINFAARMTSDEIQRWEQDGYFLREDVFSPEENDDLRQVAEDIAGGLALARRIMKSGDARDLVEKWVALTRGAGE